MGIKLTNNANATLAAGINSSATSITLTSGQGARFPTLGAGDYFYATLVDTSNNLEIVKCTARSTDVLTVVRAQESTTARAYNTGDRIEIRLTAQTFIDAVNEIGPTQVSDEANTSTGYFQVPKGTTAQRPVSPSTGMIRFNTTLDYLEEYIDGEWVGLSNIFAAEGGTVTTSGGYKTHTFTSSGTFTILSGSKSVSYLVVGGGGSGGNDNAGGGGAGGLIYTASRSLTVGSYSIVIGAGGANRGDVGGDDGPYPLSGSNSSAFGDTAIGGGAGGSAGGAAALSGGSGGGGYGNSQGPASNAAGSGTSGQGNSGGINTADGGGGGGGGGAGAAGQTVSGNQGGAGGNGLQYDISGTNTYYAGGGGGGNDNDTSGTSNVGGLGGGGLGGSADRVATAGAANTGGGGGGGMYVTTTGRSGGSGIVIIRYAI